MWDGAYLKIEKNQIMNTSFEVNDIKTAFAYFSQKEGGSQQNNGWKVLLDHNLMCIKGCWRCPPPLMLQALVKEGRFKN